MKNIISADVSDFDIVLKPFEDWKHEIRDSFEDDVEYKATVKSTIKMIGSLYGFYDNLEKYIKSKLAILKVDGQKSEEVKKLKKDLNEINALLKNIRTIIDKTTYYINALYNIGILSFNDVMIIISLILYCMEIYNKIIQIFKMWMEKDYSNDNIDNVCCEEIIGMAISACHIMEQENKLKRKIANIFRII